MEEDTEGEKSAQAVEGADAIAGWNGWGVGGTKQRRRSDG
jgi:hypothetical protein